jgi:hypothetical protein
VFDVLAAWVPVATELLAPANVEDTDPLSSAYISGRYAKERYPPIAVAKPGATRARPGRDESGAQRLDRDLAELLQELRVAGLGVHYQLTPGHERPS